MDERGFSCVVQATPPPQWLSQGAHALTSDEVANAFADFLQESHQGLVERHTWQTSLGAFAVSPSNTCKLASRDGTTALAFGVEEQGDAALPAKDPLWLLDFYESVEGLSDEDLQQAVVGALARLRGPFAVVIHDEQRRRVLAARDSRGTAPLYWGLDRQGLLMLGTCARDLSECFPSCTAFPAGTLFLGNSQLSCHCPGALGWTLAEGARIPGQLHCFVPSLAHSHPWRHVQAIPRINSRGALCGSVFRVESERALASYAAASRG